MNNLDNVSQFPESVELVASAWLAKLDRGDLSNTEKQQLTNWLKQHSMHRVALSDQLSEWSDMDVLSELAHLDLAITKNKTSWSGRLSLLWDWNRPVAYAASLASMALIVLVFTPTDFSLNPASETKAVVDLGISTEVGQQISESLPDGSVLHLNTTSIAEITYTREERSVELKTGEAFFDVAPESDRPFVVYAGETSVRAVGTAFAVHLIDGTVQVSVTEGTVEFTSGGEKYLVSAKEPGSENLFEGSALGNVALYSGDQISLDTQPMDVLERRLAWQSGMLEFRGESLDYVVSELGRYTDARIEILDEDIKDVRLGGYFKIGDIEGLASTLELGFNIQVAVVSDELIQISRGPDY